MPILVQNTKQILMLTDAQMAAVSNPTEGTLIYNTTQKHYYFWNGSEWHGMG